MVPSCLQPEKASVVLKNIPLSGGQEKMLAALCEAIIPKTSAFIGAADIKAHEFVLTMMDDCEAPEDQKTFVSGMNLFEAESKKVLNTSFANASAEQRKSFLQQMEKSKEESAVNKFYHTVKGLSIQAFTSSEKYLVDIRQYKIIPGSQFKGCVPIQKAS